MILFRAYQSRWRLEASILFFCWKWTGDASKSRLAFRGNGFSGGFRYLHVAHVSEITHDLHINFLWEVPQNNQKNLPPIYTKEGTLLKQTLSPASSPGVCVSAPFSCFGEHTYQLVQQLGSAKTHSHGSEKLLRYVLSVTLRARFLLFTMGGWAFRILYFWQEIHCLRDVYISPIDT